MDFLRPENKRLLGKQRVMSRHTVKWNWNIPSLFRVPVIVCIFVVIAGFSLGDVVSASGPGMNSSNSGADINGADINQLYALQALPGLQIGHEEISLRNPPQRSNPLKTARIYPAPEIQDITLSYSAGGNPRLALKALPDSSSQMRGKIVGKTKSDDYIFLTLDPELQALATELIESSPATHAALVAVEPSTGRLLALAQKSNSIENPLLHAEFPAASLFKVVTTAAALEKENIQPESIIKFRGGTYTLNRYNYQPDTRRDSRTMSLQEALGKSCNPAFARVAFNYLKPAELERYAFSFGFNSQLPFEADLPISRATIPSSTYEYTRTAAGFGKVFISPVHAVSMMAGLANQGRLTAPTLIDQIISKNGEVLYTSKPASVRQIVKPDTAQALLNMMTSTTTEGTSRTEFMRHSRPVLSTSVAGKTGTLRGSKPEGINNWFIGAAPVDNPRIAVAVVLVYPNSVSSRSSRVARKLLQRFLDSPDTTKA